jgi:protease-4
MSTQFPPIPPDPRHSVSRIVDAPQTTSITIKGGFWRGAIGAVTGLVAAAFIFILGLVLGIGGGVAAVSGTMPVQTTTVREGFSSTVAILPIQGGIDEFTAEFVDRSVLFIIEDGGFDAVVLRVDSGGGGVTASDQIWHSIGKLKAAGIPVVASYGGMAASGGYYVSCAADEIIAEPTCVTGSIGVIAQVFTMEGLVDKVGIRPITIIATGSPDKATGNDTFRSWDEKDRAVVQKLLDVSHANFVQRVFDGRRSKFQTIEAARAVATGEVFDAERAMQQGLIDSIGYLDDAIAAAEGRAGLAQGSAAIVRFEQPIDVFGGLLGASAKTPAIRSAADLRSLASELATPRLKYQVNF